MEELPALPPGRLVKMTTLRQQTDGDFVSV